MKEKRKFVREMKNGVKRNNTCGISCHNNSFDKLSGCNNKFNNRQ